ncbi:hypothetical protein [Calidifontibacter terrae]
MLDLALGGQIATWKVNTVAAELFAASAQTAARVEEQLLATRGWKLWGKDS